MKDWKTAHEYAATLVAAGSRSVQRKPGEKTVKFAVDEYLRFCDADGSNVGKATLAEYEVFFKERLVPWSTQNQEILLTDLEDLHTIRQFSMSWKNLKNGEPLGRNTRKKLIQQFRSFFAFCIDSKWIHTNEAKKLGKGTAAAEEDEEEDGAKVGLELSEYEQVLAALDSYPDNTDLPPINSTNHN